MHTYQVGADAEEEGAQENEDPELEQIEKEAAAEKERERALKRRQEAVARVVKEEQEKLELAQQAEEVGLPVILLHMSLCRITKYASYAHRWHSI